MREYITLTPDITGPADTAQGMAQRQDQQSVGLYEIGKAIGDPRISRRVTE